MLELGQDEDVMIGARYPFALCYGQTKSVLIIYTALCVLLLHAVDVEMRNAVSDFSVCCPKH